MCKSTYIDAMYKFCKVVIAAFDKVYLREPNTEDTARLVHQRNDRVSWDAGHHRFHALTVEELYLWLVRKVQMAFRGVHGNTRGSYIT
jgi:hypothetical protein